MMPNQTATQPQSQDTLPIVELIGGPLCGDRVQWPTNLAWAQFPYKFGLALYVYEGKGKAKYREG